MKHEVRLQEQPDRFDGKRWHYKTRRLIRLGDVGKWSMVRRADNSQAMPFVISFKEWNALAIEAATAGETQSGSTEGESAGRAATTPERNPR